MTERASPATIMFLVSDITGVGAQKHWTTDQIPSQAGKVYVVTGGHAGLGFETTKALALAGATVYIASRSAPKVKSAKQELVAEHPELASRLKFLEIDLASLKSAKHAGEEFLTRSKRLDGVVCNAGVMVVPYQLTDDGIEQSFQVNHLSHWVLVQTLLPLLQKTGQENGHPTRVINLSSFAHNFVSIQRQAPRLADSLTSATVSQFSWNPFASPSFTSIQDVNRKYDGPGWIRYSQAKLAAILFARELNKRCGPDVQSIPVHPGFVHSGLYDHMAFARPFLGLLIPVDDGVISTLYALTSLEVEERKLWGSYLVPHAKVKETTAYGNDAKLASDLWDLCEAISAEKLGSASPPPSTS
ncbi:hypothetical protein RQP46_001580 [Phenoliferia psychrophenolica]